MFLLYNSGKVRGVGECKKWGICVKCISHHFSLLNFLSIWENKKSGPRRENFLPHFLSLLFSFLNQTVENNIFHPIFLSLFSILPVFTPTKNTLNSNIGRENIFSKGVVGVELYYLQQHYSIVKLVRACEKRKVAGSPGIDP